MRYVAKLKYVIPKRNIQKFIGSLENLLIAFFISFHIVHTQALQFILKPPSPGLAYPRPPLSLSFYGLFRDYLMFLHHPIYFKKFSGATFFSISSANCLQKLFILCPCLCFHTI